MNVYLELNNNTEAMLYGDLALSTADPTGLTIIVTAAVEAEAYHDFKNWADEHAPGLSQAHFEALSMSMFTRFFQNTTDNPLRQGTIYFVNEDTKSILIFNPNQLNNPKFDEAEKLPYFGK